MRRWLRRQSRSGASVGHVHRTQEMGACVSSFEEVEQPSKKVSPRRKASEPANSPAGSRGKETSPRRSPHSRKSHRNRLQHIAARLLPGGGIWNSELLFARAPVSTVGLKDYRLPGRSQNLFIARCVGSKPDSETRASRIPFSESWAKSTHRGGSF